VIITIFGQTYNSYAAIGRAFGLTKDTVSHRISICGLDAEVAVSMIGRLSSKSKPIYLDGKWFGSKASVYEYYKVAKKTVLARIEEGKSFEQAVRFVGYPKPSRYRMKFMGRWYSSKSEIFKEYKISKNTVNKRIKQGLSFEEAVTMPTAQNSLKDCRGYTYGIFSRPNKIAYIGYSATPESRIIRHKHNALKRQELSIHHLINDLGIENFEFTVLSCSHSCEEALETEQLLISQYAKDGYHIVNKNRGGAGGGITTEALHFYAKHEAPNVDYSVFSDRVNRQGWSFEDAISVPKGGPASNPNGNNSFIF